MLRGGPSNEYEISLESGASVLGALRDHFEGVYQPRDVFIDRQGIWHIDGVSVLPEDISTKIDVAFNALHGTYGEDGKVQSLLESHGVPFTGSGSLGSAVGMNKTMTKNIFSSYGIKSPLGKQIKSSDIRNNPRAIAGELFQTFIFPAVVKPNSSGSSVGVSIVKDFSVLIPALENAAKYDEVVLVEEFIPGIEATCGVIENFRGQELYTLPPIEICAQNGFFDYEAKYQGKSEEIVPATFAESIKKSLEELAAKAHRALGLRHYSRSDFIIHPRRGIYVLEVNTLPGLTKESLVPKSLRAVGSDVHELVGHLIEMAMEK